MYMKYYKFGDLYAQLEKIENQAFNQKSTALGDKFSKSKNIYFIRDQLRLAQKYREQNRERARSTPEAAGHRCGHGNQQLPKESEVGVNVDAVHMGKEDC